MTGLEAGEAAEVPAGLAAVAVKVYVSPLVSPVTVHSPAALWTVQVWPPRTSLVESAAVTV
jgi:hypothetical protein